MFAILKVMDHTTFRRQGNDLYMTKRIGVVESLCGCSFDIDFLDGRALQLKVDPGEVIRPGQWCSSDVRCMCATRVSGCSTAAPSSALVDCPVT